MADGYDFRELERLRDLQRMTAELVRRYTDFPSLEDYLNGYAITGARLAQLTSRRTSSPRWMIRSFPVGDSAARPRAAGARCTVTRFAARRVTAVFLAAPRRWTWSRRR